jgi:hypothetical protein
LLQEDLTIVIKKAKFAAGAAVATSLKGQRDGAGKKEAKKPEPKKAAPEPKKAAKKDESSDDESSSEDEKPTKKAAPAKKATPTPNKTEKKEVKEMKEKSAKKAKKPKTADSSDEEAMEDSGAKVKRQSPRLKPMPAPEAPKWGEKVDKKRKRTEDENHEAAEDAGNAPLTDFDISEDTQRKLKEAGITSLFPIQAATFKHVMGGKDLIARARTGTGKTLSFVLPVHERMAAMRREGIICAGAKKARAPVCLVLSPTRELTKQIGKVFETVAAGSFSVLTVYGGVPYDQQGTALRAGVDVVVGTPGRVMDFMDRGQLKMDKIRFFVLDEADEMLNIGFKLHVDKIFACVVGDMGEGAGADDERQTEVQTLLFSATVPPWVKEVTTKYFKKETTVNVDLVSGPNPLPPCPTPLHASLVPPLRALARSGDAQQVARESASVPVTHSRPAEERSPGHTPLLRRRGVCYLKCNTWVTSKCNVRGFPQVQHARLLQVQRAVAKPERCVLRGRAREQRACMAHARARSRSSPGRLLADW